MGAMTRKMPVYELNDGIHVPVMGFGTYNLRGEAGVKAIHSAVDYGYRLLDSAFNYENEGAVGKAVRTCGVPRDQMRVCSKLPGRHQRYRAARTAIEESLYRTGLDYYDLYLIHWPNPSKDLYSQAWEALIDAKERGLVRSIGVSNFLPEHLDRLIDDTGVAPSVNQIELHPYFPQRRQRGADNVRGIRTQSWSPLGRASAVLKEPEVVDIAQQHGKSVAQVIVRWHIQLGSIPIPKSAHPARQEENIDVFDFELTSAQMATISGLGREDGRTEEQDPAVYEEF